MQGHLEKFAFCDFFSRWRRVVTRGIIESYNIELSTFPLKIKNSAFRLIIPTRMRHLRRTRTEELLQNKTVYFRLYGSNAFYRIALQFSDGFYGMLDIFGIARHVLH